MKHFIIAANLGYDISIPQLKECYNGVVSKEDFAAPLRAHQAVDKSTEGGSSKVLCGAGDTFKIRCMKNFK